MCIRDRITPVVIASQFSGNSNEQTQNNLKTSLYKSVNSENLIEMVQNEDTLLKKISKKYDENQSIFFSWNSDVKLKPIITDYSINDKEKNNFNYDKNTTLIVMAKEGNKEAMNKLIEVNTPLVSSICKRFTNRGYDYEDIFQIGSMGLVKAINNFNDSFNVKFSTYAVPMIIGEIKRFLRDDGIIKVSRSTKTLAKKLHYNKEELIKKLNRDPTVDELAEYSGVDKEEVIVALESASSMQYLYDTIHHDEGTPVLLIDKLSEKGEDDDMVNKIALKQAISSLDSKGKQIIMLRYFKDKTQIQVAKMLGISQVQVSRIEKKVLKIMKEKLEEDWL